MNNDFIDLTEETPEKRSKPPPSHEDDILPIGVDICPDMVDLADDADTEDTRIVDYDFDSYDFNAANWKNIKKKKPTSRENPNSEQSAAKKAPKKKTIPKKRNSPKQTNADKKPRSRTISMADGKGSCDIAKKIQQRKRGRSEASFGEQKNPSGVNSVPKILATSYSGSCFQARVFKKPKTKNPMKASPKSAASHSDSHSRARNLKKPQKNTTNNTKVLAVNSSGSLNLSPAQTTTNVSEDKKEKHSPRRNRRAKRKRNGDQKAKGSEIGMQEKGPEDMEAKKGSRKNLESKRKPNNEGDQKPMGSQKSKKNKRQRKRQRQQRARHNDHTTDNQYSIAKSRSQCKQAHTDYSGICSGGIPQNRHFEQGIQENSGGMGEAKHKEVIGSRLESPVHGYVPPHGERFEYGWQNVRHSFNEKPPAPYFKHSVHHDNAFAEDNKKIGLRRSPESHRGRSGFARFQSNREFGPNGVHRRGIGGGMDRGHCSGLTRDYRFHGRNLQNQHNAEACSEQNARHDGFSTNIGPDTTIYHSFHESERANQIENTSNRNEYPAPRGAVGCHDKVAEQQAELSDNADTKIPPIQNCSADKHNDNIVLQDTIHDEALSKHREGSAMDIELVLERPREEGETLQVECAGIGMIQKDISNRQKGDSEHSESRSSVSECLQELEASKGECSPQEKGTPQTEFGSLHCPQNDDVRLISGMEEKGGCDLKCTNSIEQGVEKNKKGYEEHGVLSIELNDTTKKPEPYKDQEELEIGQDGFQMPSGVLSNGEAVNTNDAIDQGIIEMAPKHPPSRVNDAALDPRQGDTTVALSRDTQEYDQEPSIDTEVIEIDKERLSTKEANTYVKVTSQATNQVPSNDCEVIEIDMEDFPMRSERLSTRATAANVKGTGQATDQEPSKDCEVIEIDLEDFQKHSEYLPNNEADITAQKIDHSTSIKDSTLNSERGHETTQEEFQMPRAHLAVKQKRPVAAAENLPGIQKLSQIPPSRTSIRENLVIDSCGEDKSRCVPRVDQSTSVGINEKKIASFLEEVHGFERKQSDVIEIDSDVEICDDKQSCDSEQLRFDTTKPTAKQDDVTLGSFDQAESLTDSVPLKRKRFKPNKQRTKHAKNSQNSTDDSHNMGKHAAKPTGCVNEQSETHKLKEDRTRVKTRYGRTSEQNRKQETKQKNVNAERRYVFHPINSHRTTSKRPNRYPTEATKTSWFERNFSYNFSHEDALREQERLFQESAARMQFQFRVMSHSHHDQSREVTFDAPVQDVAKQYPNHWQFIDPYARLGLPSNAATYLVKSQYRRLALIYHPDKSRDEGSATKFQAVTEAYRSILDT